MRPAEFNAETNTNEAQHGKTIKELDTYLWPANRWDLKTRLVLALFFLVAAKGLNIYVPYLLKLAIDDFTLTQGA
ncbi:MAG: hypothetical protein MJK18_03660, partial [Bdellovibrionales bacterium]|nr:hypothetical protein [Bdellovibrionales bacterium]